MGRILFSECGRRRKKEEEEEELLEGF